MIPEEIRTIESCLTLHLRSSERGSVRSLWKFELGSTFHNYFKRFG